MEASQKDFSTMVSPFIDAGFRLVDKEQSMSNFKDGSNDCVTMIAAADVQGMPVDYAILNLFKGRPRETCLVLAFDGSNEEGMLNQLQDLGLIGITSPCGKIAAHVLPEYGKDPVESLLDKLYKISEMELKTVKYPMDACSLNMLPAFADSYHSLYALDEIEIAREVGIHVGDHYEVMDLTNEQINYFENKIDSRENYQFAQPDPLRRSDSPRPSMKS